MAKPFRPHATLRYVAPGQEYHGPTPEGSWTATSIEVWGHERRIPVALTGTAPRVSVVAAKTDQAVARLQRRLAESVAGAQEDVERAVRALALAHADAFRRKHLEEARGELGEAVNRVLWAGQLGARLEARFGPPAAEPETFAPMRAPFDAGWWADYLAGDVSRLDVGGVGEAVQSVGFVQAIEDLRERDAIGADDLARIGLEVGDVYGGVPGPGGSVVFPHAFAAVRAADHDTAARVKALLVEGLAGGSPTPSVVARLVEAWDWPTNYAANVTRTNYGTATTAGRFVEASKVQRETGVRQGFRFVCVDDSDVRRGRPQDHGENHLALDGLVARVDDPLWRSWSPPGGYNCRCFLQPAVGDDVPDKFVAVPRGAAFAPGFGTRSDLRTWGA